MSRNDNNIPDGRTSLIKEMSFYLHMYNSNPNEMYCKENITEQERVKVQLEKLPEDILWRIWNAMRDDS